MTKALFETLSAEYRKALVPILKQSNTENFLSGLETAVNELD